MKMYLMNNVQLAGVVASKIKAESKAREIYKTLQIIRSNEKELLSEWDLKNIVENFNQYKEVN